NAEVAADPIAVANGLVPGDLKYRDQNGDNVINADDRVIIGSYLPTFTYGGNLGVTYKNFDLSIAFLGQTGNEILNRKRSVVIITMFTHTDAALAVNRWHGEDTSNKYAASAGRRKAWNQNMSTFFIYDVSFFQIQNIPLAYTTHS